MKIDDRAVKKMIAALSSDPKRNCYVYALCNQAGVPFYIGQGQGARMLAHERELEQDLKSGRRLTDKLRAIRGAGSGLQRVIIKWGLAKQEALMCESAMINLVKYVVAGLGKVGSLANECVGHSSGPEKLSRASDKSIARTFDDFVRECGAEERGIKALGKYKIACIKINKLYPDCLQAPTESERDERIRECVRGCWAIGNAKRERIQYLFALYRQQVVGIYHVVECIPCNHLSLQGRKDLFPTYPKDVRQIDRHEASFKNLKDARESLPATKFQALDSRLRGDYRYKKHMKSKAAIMAGFQKRRVFFVVDNVIPDDIQMYKNCILTRNGKSDFLTKGHMQYNPVWLNFR